MRTLSIDYSPGGGSGGASLADWHRVMDARRIGSRHGRHGNEILQQEGKVVGVVVVIGGAVKVAGDECLDPAGRRLRMIDD